MLGTEEEILSSLSLFGVSVVKSTSKMVLYFCLGLEPLLAPESCFFLFSFVVARFFGVLDLSTRLDGEESKFSGLPEERLGLKSPESLEKLKSVGVPSVEELVRSDS